MPNQNKNVGPNLKGVLAFFFFRTSQPGEGYSPSVTFTIVTNCPILSRSRETI
jgi:hypothetical protein